MSKTKKHRKSSLGVSDRLRGFRRQMAKRGLHAVLISNPRDYFYLTGFTGEDSAVLVTRPAVYVVTDGRFQESVRRECPWTTVRLRRGMLNAEIASVCKRLKLRTLAVQGEHLTLSNHDEIRKLAGLRRLAGAPPILAEMRRTKEPAEMKAIRRAVRVAQEAFLAVRETIRYGQTELEMAARLEYEMKVRGASTAAFETICAVGPNAALPHARPGRRRVTRNCAILFDWGARVDGYCSDLTRMVFVDSIPPRIREVYRVVLEAQRRAVAGVSAGRRVCDVDALAREYIAQHGYGDAFNHGLGHGLGLDVHEPPVLSWRSKEMLRAGMVVTVEPGVYLPGVGGVRIEDDVLVTADGCRVLTHLSRDIEEAVIHPSR